MTYLQLLTDKVNANKSLLMKNNKVYYGNYVILEVVEDGVYIPVYAGCQFPDIISPLVAIGPGGITGGMVVSENYLINRLVLASLK